MNSTVLALAEVDSAVNRELARVEAAHPRPKKVPCIWDRVNFMEWDTWQDLGLLPPAGEQR